MFGVFEVAGGEVGNRAVGQDLVAARDPHVDILARSDLDIDVVADFEFRQRLRPGIAAEQDLSFCRDFRVARFVHHARGFGDLSVDDSDAGDLGGYVIGAADRTVERMVSPRLVVHTDGVGTQLRVVQSAEFRLLPVMGQRSRRGEHRHGCLLVLERERRFGLLRADAHALPRHRGVDRCPRLVDVEERAVDGGHGLLPLGSARHDLAGGTGAGDLSRVADVHRQGVRGEVRGEHIAVVPPSVLETGEVRQVESRSHAFGFDVAQCRPVPAEVVLAWCCSMCRCRGGTRKTGERSDGCDRGSEDRQCGEDGGDEKSRSGGMGSAV